MNKLGDENMPYSFNESDYENSVIELFQNMDYNYVYGPDVDRDIKSPLYEDVLDESIRKINPGADEKAIVNALYKLHNFENADLISKNM